MHIHYTDPMESLNICTFFFTLALQRVIISKSFTAMTPHNDSPIMGSHKSKILQKMIFRGARAETKISLS